MTTRPTFATRRDAMNELNLEAPLVKECAYCLRWFHAARRDALTCSTSCRKALSRARTQKHFRRPSWSGHSAAPSFCATPEERAMRDLRARSSVAPGPSRWNEGG